MSSWTMDKVAQLIIAERYCQIAKWGEPTHTDGVWFLILTEELGGASRSLLEGDRISGAEELVQAAAVIVAWLEDMLSGRQQARAAAGQPANQEETIGE